MPLTPKESSSTTRPADVSPNASVQGYFRDDCATLVTYEWLNEGIADKVNALNFLSIPITPNDDNATKKMFEKMLTGGLDYEVNSITVDGRVPFLKGADIPDAADLNNYTEDGYYHQNTNVQAVSGQNYPIDEAGMLIVHSDGLMVYQTYYNYRQKGYYIRSRFNDSQGGDTWYPWAEIWTSETDGSGSGLDADLLDGNQGSHYTNADNLNAGKIPASRMTGQDYTVNSLTASGGKIGLSGDGSQDYLQFTDNDNYLRGYENGVAGRVNVQFGTGDYTNLNASDQMTVAGVSVRDAAVLTSGKINNARLESTINSNTTGNAATATQAENADKLDGYHASAFADAPVRANFTPDLSILLNSANSAADFPITTLDYCYYTKQEFFCRVNFLAKMGSVSDNNGEAFLNLPFTARDVQALPACWFEVSAASYPSASDVKDYVSVNSFGAGSPVGYWGNGLVRGGRFYFKTDAFDTFGAGNISNNRWLFLTFQYEVA